MEEYKKEIKNRKVYILNAPVLTGYGVFRYRKSELQEVKELLATNNFVSAVGHEATAKLMSEIIGISIPVNRIAVEMLHGDVAVVFRLLQRIPEGKILNLEELKNLPYELSILLFETF
jgi:hypothetical protein